MGKRWEAAAQSGHPPAKSPSQESYVRVDNLSSVDVERRSVKITQESPDLTHAALCHG
jgi:hypothetical protein